MILKLEELEPLWQEAGAAERGTLLHTPCGDSSKAIRRWRPMPLRKRWPRSSTS